MTSDVEKLREFIGDLLRTADSEKRITFDIKDLNEIPDARRKMNRLLDELQKDGFIGKHSYNDDCGLISIEMGKKLDIGFMAVGSGDSDHCKNVEGLYHITKDFLNELQKSEYLTESKLQYYRLSGDMKDILSIVGRGMTLPYEELLNVVIDGINKFLSIGEEEWIPTRAFFITGNGGVGKTTLLVTAAVKMARDTDREVYVMQIKADQSKDYADEIINSMKGDKEKLLFIDNPYDNLDVSRHLIECIRSDKNIRLVFSERANRLEQIFKNPNLSFISNIAGAVVIGNQGSQSYSKQDLEDLKFVRSSNTEKFILSEYWKKQVVARMISYILPESIKIEDERLQRILEMTNYIASPCEMLLQVCLQYNQEIEEQSEQDRTIEVKIPFQFDWDEWKKIFSKEKDPDCPSKELSLRNIFPFIAALGLYKIPVTTGFIASLIKVNEVELSEFLNERLTGIEPVRYNGEKIILKHDIIADLYFQAHKKEKTPQYYLMEAIKYLDEFMIIKYERYVLSTRIIRGKREVPHDSINTVALLRSFEQYESYIQCLKDRNRYYSYEYARIFSMIQEKGMTEEEFQNEWTQMLNKVPDKKNLRLSTWINCFTACMEMDWFPPDYFFTVIEQIDYRVATSYMSNFESFVQTGGYDIFLYRKIAKKTFQSIMDNHEGDIPSLLALVKVLVKQNAILEAENVLKEILEKDIADKYKICVEYASVCRERFLKINKKIEKNKRWRKRNSSARMLNKKKENVQGIDRIENVTDIEIAQADEKKSFQKSSLKEQRKYYFERAEKYYRMAVDIAPEKERAQSLCALANFLLKTSVMQKEQSQKIERMQEAEDCLSRALMIGTNNSSAYNALAMVHTHDQKWNPFFDPVKADKYFEMAVEDCPKDRLVTRYVPWGNLNYNIGRLRQSKEKYEKALQYKSDEKRAIKAIELIDEEQHKLDELLQEEPVYVKNFGQLYYYFNKNKRVLKRKLFVEEATQREILRLVYKSCLSEKITPEILRKCKKAMTSLSVIGKIEKTENEEKYFLYLRVAQYLQMCCIECKEKPYLSPEKEQMFAHEALVHFLKRTD